MLNSIILVKLILSVILGSFGQICFKLGANSLKANLFDNILLFLTNKMLFLGLVLYGLSTIIYVTTLSKIELSLAYPVISLSYIIVLFLSYFLLNEALSFYKILGTMLILGGVIVLSIK